MNRLAVFFVIIAASLWGMDGVLLRPYLYNLPVSLVVFTESLLIVVITTLFFSKSVKKFFNLSKSAWSALAGVALLGGVIGTMSITKALFYVNYVNLSIVVLIQKLQPVFAIILASVLLKERPPRIFYIWASVAIISAYIMTFGFSFPNLKTPGDKTVPAAFFSILAVFGFAASTVLSKHALRSVDFKSATYQRFLLTAFLMLIISVSTGNISSISNISETQWIVFIIIAIITGGPGIFLYYYGLTHIKASTATICELAFPLTAIILEFILRKNILAVDQWLGVLLLFYAITKITKLENVKMEY